MTQTTAAEVSRANNVDAGRDGEKEEEEGSSTSATVSNETKDLSKDRIFGLLSVERRRQILRYLNEEEESTTLGEVAEYIAARENDVEVSEITSSQRKRVYVALYQSHLPKLDDANVIASDRNRGTIEPGPNADQLMAYLYFDPAETESGLLFSNFSAVSEITARVKESIVD